MATEQEFQLRERALRRRLRQTQAISMVFAGVSCVAIQQLSDLQWGRDGEDEDGSDEDGSDEDEDEDDEDENGDSNSDDDSSGS
ncbi:hypothetical protein HYALB_00001141 [Hymenoscyphus albidus]|uniref:Uncharacterized protein n=1 Tax=Hymenoscyphus albidus TaxID=595503 RepID=A0A9N9Q2J7_9HELO|nr:hypothetical protein HYALB_00001141 [Hymenoscyphus albidus]